jgi:hypothetical protein
MEIAKVCAGTSALEIDDRKLYTLDHVHLMMLETYLVSQGKRNFLTIRIPAQAMIGA